MEKYTLVGTLLNKDRKYMLKEFLFISAYSNACLRINHFVVWPLGFSLAILPTFFLLMEFGVRKVEGCIASKEGD